LYDLFDIKSELIYPLPNQTALNTTAYFFTAIIPAAIIPAAIIPAATSGVFWQY
ncbi:hypothetical protein Tco_0510195, partial [Tanacetum coccineum]